MRTSQPASDVAQGRLRTSRRVKLAHATAWQAAYARAPSSLTAVASYPAAHGSDTIGDSSP